jgi:hypothetical protein
MIFIDSEIFLVTDFLNLKIKLTQSFKSTRINRIYIYIYKNIYSYIYKYVSLYCISENRCWYGPGPAPRSTPSHSATFAAPHSTQTRMHMAAPPREIPRRGLFIGGGWREPSLGRRLPVVNPATEATIGTSALHRPPLRESL